MQCEQDIGHRRLTLETGGILQELQVSESHEDSWNQDPGSGDKEEYRFGRYLGGKLNVWLVGIQRWCPHLCATHRIEGGSSQRWNAVGYKFRMKGGDLVWDLLIWGGSGEHPGGGVQGTSGNNAWNSTPPS